MKVDGVSVLHTIISPQCQQVHGNLGLGAFDEACHRIREEYARCVEGWKDSEKKPTYHLVLTMDRPGRKKVSGEEGDNAN